MFKTIYTFIIVLLLAACAGDAQRKADHIQRAMAYSEQSAFDKARIEYKNALQIDPKDYDTRFLLGQVLEKVEDWRGATSQYLTIVHFNDEHIPAKLRLAKLYLLGKATDKGLALVEQVLAVKPDNSIALYLKAGAYEQKRDTERAMHYIRLAVKADPDNTEAIALLASLLMGNDKTGQAIALLGQSIEKNPDDIRLRLLLGKIFSSQGQYAQSIKQFQYVIDHEPGELSHRTRLANLYTHLQRLDEAEAVLQESVSRMPTDTTAKLLLGSFLAKHRDAELAEKTFLKFIESDPEKYLLRFSLAQLYENSEYPDRARNVYKEIIELAGVNREGLNATVKLAGMYARARDFETANKLVNKVLDVNPQDNEALILRGNIALFEKEAFSAVSDYRTVLSNQPDDTKVRRLLSRAHLLNSEREQAIDNLLRVIEVDKEDVKARYELARLQAQSGEVDKAVKQLQAIIQITPEHLNAREALFNLYLSRNELDLALAVADETKSLFKDQYPGFYFTGKVYQRQKKYQASIDEFNQALNTSQGESKVLTSLVNSYMALKQYAGVEKFLVKQLEESANKVVILNLLGNVSFTQEKFIKAIGYYKEAQQLKPEWVAIYRNLARVYLARNDRENALDTYKSGLRNTNRALVLVVELANYYKNDGDIDSAINEYKSYLTQNPDNELVTNNLVMLLVDYKKNKQSLDLAFELAQRFKNTNIPMYSDSLGWVLYKQDKFDEAIPYLEYAVKTRPQSAAIRYHLGMTYYSKNENRLALRHLKKSLDMRKDYFGIEEARMTLDAIQTDS